jgi:hypothetical protein
MVVAGGHEQTDTSDLQDRKPARVRQGARARRLATSLTIRFDPEMTWAATPTGKRGRQPDCDDAAIQTCLTMKGEGRPENGPVDRFQP